MKITMARLSTQDQLEYELQRTELSAGGIALAREFQKLAFSEKIFEDNFEPAPLFVRQAYEVSKLSDEKFLALTTALNLVAREALI